MRLLEGVSFLQPFRARQALLGHLLAALLVVGREPMHPGCDDFVALVRLVATLEQPVELVGEGDVDTIYVLGQIQQGNLGLNDPVQLNLKTIQLVLIVLLRFS